MSVEKLGTNSLGQRKWRSPWAQALNQFRRNVSGVVGLTIFVIMTVLHVGAPLFVDIAPSEMNVKAILQPPSAEHPFGTDQFGRDLLSRVLYGGRISLLVASTVTIVTTLTGVTIGAITGYYPRLDNPIMRVMDFMMAFPMMLLAIAIVALLGPQLLNVLIAVIIPVTPWTARVVRGTILSLREQDFVTAAKAVGVRDLRVIMRHLLPNAMPTLLVRQTYVFGITILIEGALNFLGVGVQPEIPTLGSVVSEGRRFLRDKPWMSFYAGIFIGLLVLGINLLGDGLRDVLDPRMRRGV